jgi:hypothetical protein
MALTFKTRKMLRDEQFAKIVMQISEFVDAKFAGDRTKSEKILSDLFPNEKQNYPFGIITSDGIYLTFRSKKEMREHMGLE